MNKLSEEQIEHLINFVEARPGLYDKREVSYKKIEWREKCWKELAFKFCVDEKVCKAAWRSLKDQFIKRLKALKGKTGRAAEDFPKKYKHFERLLFLADSIQPREQSRKQEQCLDPELSSFETEGIELAFNDESTTQTNTSSSSEKKRKICLQPAPFFDCGQRVSSSYTTSVPEVSPSEDSDMQNCWPEPDNSSISKKMSENLKEPDHIDVFFESMAKSAKSFRLTPVEQSTLMMGVTELLHKIVSERHK